MVKVQEVSKCSGINRESEAAEQHKAEKGIPAKRKKGSNAPRAATNQRQLPSKESKPSSKYKGKTMLVHPSETQAKSSVYEDPSTEQDAVSWYSGSAGKGENEIFGKSPNTGDHPLQTTHIDHPWQTTHTDHSWQTTRIDHLPRTTHTDDSNEWTTHVPLQQTSMAHSVASTINQDDVSTKKTTDASPPWENPYDDTSTQKYPISLDTQQSIELKILLQT